MQLDYRRRRNFIFSNICPGITFIVFARFVFLGSFLCILDGVFSEFDAKSYG